MPVDFEIYSLSQVAVFCNQLSKLLTNPRSKYPPFALTHASVQLRHCLTAASTTRYEVSPMLPLPRRHARVLKQKADILT